MGMSMWRLAWGVIALVILNQAAFAGGRPNQDKHDDIGDRFLE